MKCRVRELEMKVSWKGSTARGGSDKWKENFPAAILALFSSEAGCGLGSDIQRGLMDIVHNECCFARPQPRLIKPNLCYWDELSVTSWVDRLMQFHLTINSALLHISLSCFKITVLFSTRAPLFSVALGAKNFSLYYFENIRCRTCKSR